MPAPDIHTFPNVVVDRNGPVALVFVDNNALLNFDRIGQLDTLLAANRLVVITPEVEYEAVQKAIVYDESDEIARPPQDWSTEWLARSLSQPKEDLWVVQGAWSYPQCKRTIRTFDTHYYFLSEEC